MEKRATIQDVAKRAGVSITTVSRVINRRPDIKIRKSTEQRVLEAISELQFLPVKAARSLRFQQTHALGLLLPDISNPFFSLLARGVESISFQAGYSTLICDSDSSLSREARHVSVLLQEDIDGLVLVPVGGSEQEHLQRLRRSRTHLVVADRRMEGIISVEADNATGSFKLTQHLLELGYRRFAYIRGPQGVSTAEDRLRGFLRAMDEADVAPVVIMNGDFTYESGVALGKEAIRTNPIDGIVAGNDLMAIGVCHVAESLGLHIPVDLGVAGFDGVSWASLVRPRLTTVKVPFYEIGQEATRLLIESLSADRQPTENMILDVKIIEGESTCRQS